MKKGTKCKPYKIGNAVYYCSEERIKKAGGLKQAAEQMAKEREPLKPMKPQAVKAEVKGETPEKE